MDVFLPIQGSSKYPNLFITGTSRKDKNLLASYNLLVSEKL